jgi:hypothetical protein
MKARVSIRKRRTSHSRRWFVCSVSLLPRYDHCDGHTQKGGSDEALLPRLPVVTRGCNWSVGRRAENRRHRGAKPISVRFTNIRMGLSAHLEGVMNGTFLIAVGAIWTQAGLSRPAKTATF